jgi:hypothetical protein
MGEVDDPALRRHIMLENILSSMEAVGVRGALLHPQDDGFEELAVRALPYRFARVVRIAPERADTVDRVASIATDPTIPDSGWSSTTWACGSRLRTSETSRRGCGCPSCLPLPATTTLSSSCAVCLRCR